MSRQGNPWDWNYVAFDAQAPVAGNNADAGEIGDIIKALIPYKDDFHLFGCTNSIWRLNGDPAAGGQLVEVSLAIGMFGANSWCWDSRDNLFFLGTDGLYVLSAEMGAKPENISKEKLPKFPHNWNLDPTLHRVVMGYDPERHGILICKTTLADGTNENYWYDLQTGGFFPETYPDECAVYSMVNYSAQTPAYRGLIIGGKDGYLRVFDEDTKNDAGATSVAIESHVVLGPNLLSQHPEAYAKLTSLSIVSAKNTDSITCQIFTAHTAENLQSQLASSPLNPRVSNTISDVVRPHKIRQRVKGIYGALRLVNTTTTSTWGMETIIVNLKPAGGV
jgi:hypothetical protein